MSFTIGSLFDGSGGFPLAATLNGGVPKWASEIEPYPVAVTKSRFPQMKHLGNIVDIRGDKVEPVDVISFGSPCQDLSVAGLRKGLKHEDNGDDETTRSGLFMEAVRIIKEMREATNGVYPRFALWENVPGAFSSNGGEDFRIVLEELIKVAEPTATMPPVPKGGWAYSDSYSGDGWSIAYRVLDAQYWGVPQRRRRIYLVADFRGERAGKILFESNGLRGYFAEGRTPWQTAAGNAESSIGTADCERKCVGWPLGFRPENVRVYDEIATTICNGTRPGFTCGVIESVPVAYSFDALSSNSMKSSNPHSGCREVDVAKCLDTTDPNPSKNQGGIAVVEAVPYTMKIRSGCDVDAKGKAAGKGALIQTNKASTLAVAQDQYLFQPVTDGDNQGVAAYSIENHPADSRVNIDDSGKVQTLTSRMGTGGGNVPLVMFPFAKSARARSPEDATTWKPGIVANTLNTFDQGEARANELVVESQPTVAFETYQKVSGPLMANSHPGSYTGQDAYNDMLVAGVDARNATEYPEMTGALQADAAHNLNSNNVVRVHYIVRRLTPTECARLQGFPDMWGHPTQKSELTDEEFKFWLDVRNTHAAINEKAVKDYTKEQILKWYNGLHTDSSEYKMWGNGIALPNALYVMQGIADAIRAEQEARKKWLDELLGDCQ